MNYMDHDIIKTFCCCLYFWPSVSVPVPHKEKHIQATTLSQPTLLTPSLDSAFSPISSSYQNAESDEDFNFKFVDDFIIVETGQYYTVKSSSKKA